VAGRKERKIWGIGAAPGIAEGKAHVLDLRKTKFTKRYIPATQVKREIKRVQGAIEKSKADLVKIKDALGHEEINEHVYIFNSHLMILEDPMLLDAVTEMIFSERKNAEWALYTAFDNYKKMFDTIEDEYLRERKSDFDYLNTWILKHLSGSDEDSLQNIDEKVILFAHYLSPADAARMNREKIIGFVTDIGGSTSHTAILARALKIPAVVGAERASQLVSRGDRVILDGREGLIIVNPTRESATQYRERGLKYDHVEKALLKERDLPAETIDGRRISLTANVEMVEEVQAVREYGAEGIGLYRTEFLCLGQGRIPSEAEHFQVYKSVLEQMAPFPVTIRTFDFGSDKSPNGKARILFPMISGLEELNRARDLFEEAKEEVAKKNQAFDPELEIGIMVEVPSAALIPDVLAKEVDFFSIGTNDLIQYCLAIDRVNKEVAYLYDPLHPSILRLLKMVVEAGHRQGIHVGMCGEMASDLRYIYILVGFGFDHLSMVGSMVPWIKKVVRSIDFQEARQLVETLLQGRDSAENERILSSWIQEKSPDIKEKVLSA